MMKVLSLILNFLGGGALKTVSDSLVEAQRDRLRAETDEKKLETEETISRLQAHRDILLTEQSNWATRMIRPLFALPFIIFNFKVIVWDKVLGWGSTDPLSSDLIELEMIVFGAYFLARPIEKYIKRR